MYTPDLAGGNPAHSMKVGTGWSLKSPPIQTILWFHDNSIWSMHWGKAQLLSICTLKVKRIWWRSSTLKTSSHKTKHTFCVHKFRLFYLPNQKEGNSNTWMGILLPNQELYIASQGGNHMTLFLFSKYNTVHGMHRKHKTTKLYH